MEILAIGFSSISGQPGYNCLFPRTAVSTFHTMCKIGKFDINTMKGKLIVHVGSCKPLQGKPKQTTLHHLTKSYKTHQ